MTMGEDGQGIDRAEHLLRTHSYGHRKADREVTPGIRAYGRDKCFDERRETRHAQAVRNVLPRERRPVGGLGLNWQACRYEACSLLIPENDMARVGSYNDIKRVLTSSASLANLEFGREKIKRAQDLVDKRWCDIEAWARDEDGEQTRHMDITAEPAQYRKGPTVHSAPLDGVERGPRCRPTIEKASMDRPYGSKLLRQNGQIVFYRNEISQDTTHCLTPHRHKHTSVSRWIYCR
jgi:hypothetical protein